MTREEAYKGGQKLQTYRKEGGGKWDFQLVSKRVEVAMQVTVGDDDELTTASHNINCRTIWEAQTRDLQQMDL